MRTEIAEAFAELGVEPREHQFETVSSVLYEFLRNGKSCVFVDAPTGSGKSVIAATVAKTMAKLQPPVKSVVVSSTNSLVRQYERDVASKPGAVAIYGAENYPCALRPLLSYKPMSAAFCLRKSPFFQETSESERACGECAFKKSRDGKLSQPLAVTNYSYFFVDRLFLAPESEPDNPSTFTPRDLYVFDESHLFSDHFANHCTVFFSRSRADEYLEDCELASGGPSLMSTAYRAAFLVICENAARQTIGPANVEKFLSTLMKFYSGMYNVFENHMRASKAHAEHEGWAAYKDKYRRLLCKVEDFLKYKFDCAVTCEEKDSSMSVKPVFPLGAFEHLRAKYNLFMSATMDAELMVQTLALDVKECSQIRVPYSFDLDDKTVHMPPSWAPRINYGNSKTNAVLDKVGTIVRAAAANHPNEKGIVLTTSFQQATDVAARLKDGPHNIMLHVRGEKIDTLLTKFKERLKPTILISPSLFEGIDLPGKLSEFQIVLKAPFPSMGDKRVTAIMRKYPSVFRKTTVMKLVQALGRSTRFRGDRSTSYLVDGNLRDLFDSVENKWKDQFRVVV